MTFIRGRKVNWKMGKSSRKSCTNQSNGKATIHTIEAKQKQNKTKNKQKNKEARYYNKNELIIKTKVFSYFGEKNQESHSICLSNCTIQLDSNFILFF